MGSRALSGTLIGARGSQGVGAAVQMKGIGGKITSRIGERELLDCTIAGSNGTGNGIVIRKAAHQGRGPHERCSRDVIERCRLRRACASYRSRKGPVQNI